MLRKKESLSEKYATKAYELFEKKKWKVEYCETERSVFDCFCDRLAMLDNDEQRDLILELTEDYDGIGRYLIVENHCFPVIRITL